MKPRPDDRPNPAALLPVRIDRWLWAARFFKTRTLAMAAIDGGHVHVGNLRCKPAKALKVGDRLRILTPSGEFEVDVLGLSEQRGPAQAAMMLYRETGESILARQRNREQQALVPRFDHPEAKGRPTKKWRRELHRFERAQEG